MGVVKGIVKLTMDNMCYYKPILLFSALFIFLTMHGCAGMKISAPAYATIPGVSGHIPQPKETKNKSMLKS